MSCITSSEEVYIKYIKRNYKLLPTPCITMSKDVCNFFIKFTYTNVAVCHVEVVNLSR